MPPACAPAVGQWRGRVCFARGAYGDENGMDAGAPCAVHADTFEALARTGRTASGYLRARSMEPRYAADNFATCYPQCSFFGEDAGRLRNSRPSLA